MESRNLRALISGCAVVILAILLCVMETTAAPIDSTEAAAVAEADANFVHKVDLNSDLEEQLKLQSGENKSSPSSPSDDQYLVQVDDADTIAEDALDDVSDGQPEDDAVVPEAEVKYRPTEEDFDDDLGEKIGGESLREQYYYSHDNPEDNINLQERYVEDGSKEEEDEIRDTGNDEDKSNDSKDDESVEDLWVKDNDVTNQENDDDVSNQQTLQDENSEMRKNDEMEDAFGKQDWKTKGGTKVDEDVEYRPQEERENLDNMKTELGRYGEFGVDYDNGAVVKELPSDREKETSRGKSSEAPENSVREKNDPTPAEEDLA